MKITIYTQDETLIPRAYSLLTRYVSSEYHNQERNRESKSVVYDLQTHLAFVWGGPVHYRIKFMENKRGS